MAAHSDINVTKKIVVLALLAESKVVAVQDTHWNDNEISMWEGLSPGTRVVGSSARIGPNGGPQGGVALLAPARFHLLSWRALVASCASEARVQYNAPDCLPFRVQSMYFPPDGGRSALRHYLASFSPGAAPTEHFYSPGDLNLQLFTPREDRESEDALALQEGLERAWMAAVPDIGAS